MARKQCTMIAMKPGDRVKHRASERRGTIRELGARRPSPAEAPEEDTKITHYLVGWDDSPEALAQSVRVDDLQPHCKFTERDLEYARRLSPKAYRLEGSDELGEEFLISAGDDTLVLTATENGRAFWRYESGQTIGLSTLKRSENSIKDAVETALRHKADVAENYR